MISLETKGPGYSAKATKLHATSDVNAESATAGSIADHLLPGVDGKRNQSYTFNVKNITVSVDDETYRRARIKAAERATSLSALVRRFLLDLISEESPERGLERRERELRAQIRDFSAGDRLSREEAHQRHR